MAIFAISCHDHNSKAPRPDAKRTAAGWVGAAVRWGLWGSYD
ncbi:hypothetical protein PN441_17920 [Spirulina major CS-329]|nr:MULTISPECIES: hypothetical protein [Spirulina]MDB9493092.1 hypothetical protein [Spirulina subsalsa CS-330]MDB9504959.1 hypothetical protein [Spirulina major CS-329]